MNATEIQELMRLRGWSKTDLASELHLSEMAVRNWLLKGHAPDGPASLLMGQWLAQARGRRRRRHAAVS